MNLPDTFPWKQNLVATWCIQILSLAGFSFAMPFFPFYLEELGVTDPARLKLWTGIISAAPGITMGIMAPIWGRLGDLYGRRIMMLRALLMASLLILGMSFVRGPVGLLVLRLAQGLLTGTIAAATALVATGTPEKRLPSSMGFFSTSTFVGITIGPAVGGLAAEAWGYRAVFRIAGAVIFLAVVLVLALIREPPRREPHLGANSERKKPKDTIKDLLTPVFIGTLGFLFLMRITRTAPAPYLPLYIREFRGNVMEGTVALTGLLNGGVGLATALGGFLLTRGADHWDPRKVSRTYLFLAFLAALPLALWGRLTPFALTYVLVFFFLGGVEPLIVSAMIRDVKADDRGLLIGVQTSVRSAAWALAPFIGAGITLAWSLRTLYIFLPVLILLTWAAVWGISRAARAAPP